MSIEWLIWNKNTPKISLIQYETQFPNEGLEKFWFLKCCRWLESRLWKSEIDRVNCFWEILFTETALLRKHDSAIIAFNVLSLDFSRIKLIFSDSLKHIGTSRVYKALRLPFKWLLLERETKKACFVFDLPYKRGQYIFAILTIGPNIDKHISKNLKKNNSFDYWLIENSLYFIIVSISMREGLAK